MKTLATTRYSAVRPLSVKGQRVLDLQQQLSRLVATRSGDPTHALLFARPRIIERSDSVAWDTTADGTVQRIVDLPSGEQGAAYQKFERVVGDINKVIDTLGAAGTERGALDAQLLAAALQHAGDSDVFLVGDQPVLVNWGCEPAVKEAASVKPAHIARRPPEDPDLDQKIERVARREVIDLPPVEAPPPPPRRPLAPAWWPWLAAWLVLLLVLIAEWFLVGRLVADPKAALAAARAAQASDLGALAQLDQGIVKSRASCSLGDITAASFADRIAKAGMKMHPVTITLLSNGEAGALLYVKTPSGNIINFANREPPPGDVLHADFGNKGTRTPNESIQAIVADQPLPAGHYKVFVRVFNDDHPTAAPMPFGVRVAVEGRPPVVRFGYLRSVDKWQDKPVAEFEGGS
jgi:hypothetical protein